MAMIIAIVFIALIPWTLALPVLRWHPAMQTAPARRTYRLTTAIIALVISAVSFLCPPLIAVWLIPVVAAIWLDALWFHRSRTVKGRAQLHFARWAAAHSSTTNERTAP